jgi:hypothetical protein
MQLTEIIDGILFVSAATTFFLHTRQFCHRLPGEMTSRTSAAISSLNPPPEIHSPRAAGSKSPARN